jgi:hypothetical protein
MRGVKRRVLLPMLLAVGMGLGVAACGGASKTSTATGSADGIPPRAKHVAAIWDTCIGLTEASVKWLKQVAHVSEVLGTPRQDDSLMRADMSSHRVEAAAKNVAADVPSATAAVARYVALVGTLRSLMNEYDTHDIPGALAEVPAAEKRVAAACEAASKQLVR